MSEAELEEFKRSQEGGLDIVGRRMAQRGKRKRPGEVRPKMEGNHAPLTTDGYAADVPRDAPG